MTKAEELLDKFMIGFEWDMESQPEILDKADYDFYDEVRAYFKKRNKTREKIIKILQDTDWSDNGIEKMADKILKYINQKP